MGSKWSGASKWGSWVLQSQLSIVWGLSGSLWSWCLGPLRPRYYSPWGWVLSRKSWAQSQVLSPCQGARPVSVPADPHPHSFQPPAAASSHPRSHPLPSPGRIRGTRQQGCGRCQERGQGPERGRYWGLPWGAGGGTAAVHEHRCVPPCGRPGAAPCGPHALPRATQHLPHTTSPLWMPPPGWLPDAGLSAGAEGRLGAILRILAPKPYTLPHLLTWPRSFCRSRYSVPAAKPRRKSRKGSCWWITAKCSALRIRTGVRRQSQVLWHSFTQQTWSNYCVLGGIDHNSGTSCQESNRIRSELIQQLCLISVLK